MSRICVLWKRMLGLKSVLTVTRMLYLGSMLTVLRMLMLRERMDGAEVSCWSCSWPSRPSTSVPVPLRCLSMRLPAASSSTECRSFSASQYLDVTSFKPDLLPLCC